MSIVRFPNMELKDLLTIVRESSVIDPGRLLDCIYEKVNGKRLRYRSILSKLANKIALVASSYKNSFLQHQK